MFNFTAAKSQGGVLCNVTYKQGRRLILMKDTNRATDLNSVTSH